MKKTLLVTMDFPPMTGGVAAYWQRVCESMQGENFSVLTSVADAERQHLPVPVTIRPLLSRLLWPRWLTGCRAIYKQMRQSSGELLLVGQILPVGSMAYVLHRMFGVPYVVQVYGMDIAAASIHPRKKRLAKRIVSSAHHVLVNSEATGTLLKELMGKDLPMTVVYPIPEAPRPDPLLVQKLVEQHSLANKRVILTIGRLVSRKGHDRVIDVLPDVRRAIPEAVYIIVGDGPERARIEARAAASNSDVRFMGAVSKEERDAWLSLCDVFVMISDSKPGDFEGFGMVYLEAAACGKSVIAGRSGGAVEAVDHRRTGLLVDPESKSEIVAAVTSVLQDKDLAARLGQAGKKDFDTKWNWEQMMNRLRSTLV